MSSVIHATEIHVHSLIRVRTCMGTELDAQSERGISMVCGKKIYI